jgi:hypothetical protein
MTRYIDLSDAAKGRVQLSAARKTDWTAELARIAREAETVKRDPKLTERRRERRLEGLRGEYESTLRMQRFARLGRTEA